MSYSIVNKFGGYRVRVVAIADDTIIYDEGFKNLANATMFLISLEHKLENRAHPCQVSIQPFWVNEEAFG